MLSPKQREEMFTCKVIQLHDTPQSVYFKVYRIARERFGVYKPRRYKVTWFKGTRFVDAFDCTCPHGTMRISRHNNDKYCKHVGAVIFWGRRRGLFHPAWEAFIITEDYNG